MTADLAVIIVNYNTGPWLERCLGSLDAHRGDIQTDVVVVDNASGDGSQQRAVSAHPWARLIQNPTNRYLSPAWNQGAAETDAPYLLFLNPDTEWWRGTLADYVAAAREHPEAGVVGPMIRNTDGTVYANGRTFASALDAAGHALLAPVTRNNPFTQRLEMGGWDRTTERQVDWVSGACMLLPREAFEAVGRFDEAYPLYAEEFDMAARLSDAGWTVWFTPVVEILHEVGVSIGRGRGRPHRLVVMQSSSIFRYYRLHRAVGWKRALLPIAWVVLRARAELAWLKERVG
jgi:N-acetylglucosaminyl-diphospho-decaprenol L-rhamnosyltransferase